MSCCRQASTESDAAERDRRLGAAYQEGRLAGLRLLRSGANPYDLEREPEERAEWESGRAGVAHRDIFMVALESQRSR